MPSATANLNFLRRGRPYHNVFRKPPQILVVICGDEEESVRPVVPPEWDERSGFDMSRAW